MENFQMYSLHARTTSTAPRSFSHDQHHKTDAAKGKRGAQSSGRTLSRMLQWTGRHIWLGQYHQHSSCSPIRIIRPRRQIQSWCSSVQHPFYMLCFRRRISSRPFLEALKWTFQNHLAWTTSLPTLACLWPKSSHVKISIINSDIFAAMTRFWPIYWLVAGCVVECRICNREVAGSNLSLGYFAPRSTQPSIPSGSVNEYQLRLGRQRQVWFIQIADERVGVQ